MGQVNDLLERMVRQKFGKEKVRFTDCTDRCWQLWFVVRLRYIRAAHGRCIL